MLPALCIVPGHKKEGLDCDHVRLLGLRRRIPLLAGRRHDLNEQWQSPRLPEPASFFTILGYLSMQPLSKPALRLCELYGCENKSLSSQRSRCIASVRHSGSEAGDCST